CTFNLTTSSMIQCLSVTDARIDRIYEMSENGALAVVAHELYSTSDEDDPTAETIGEAFMLVLRHPGAKPEIVKGTQFAAIACGKDKDEPCGCTRRDGQGQLPGGEGLVQSHSKPSAT